MYNKISEKHFYNPKKNHYFYETIFSKNGIERVRNIIDENKLEVIEFLENQDTLGLFDSTHFYLFKSREAILKKLKKLDKKKKYLFVNIPIELIESLKIKNFFIYSNSFPSDDLLKILNRPTFIIGRTFSNEKSSDPYLNNFEVLKFKPIGLFEFILAGVISISFILFIIYYNIELKEHIDYFTFK